MSTITIPEVVSIPTVSERTLYFDNNKVEDLLLKYVWTRCTKPILRDEIMKNAEELIRQIILAHNLHKICPGLDMLDLFQTAWIQIEKTLYKYRARPHCVQCYDLLRPQDSLLYDPPLNEYGILRPKEVSKMNLVCPTCGTIPSKICYRGTSKVFNMWSQVARTVILAYIKKENRDPKNADSYKNHLGTRPDRSQSVSMDRFFNEVIEMCQFNPTYIEIISALKRLSITDDKPHDGMVSKLVRESRQSRAQVTGFLKMIRLRKFDFSDSPANERPRTRLSGFTAGNDNSYQSEE